MKQPFTLYPSPYRYGLRWLLCLTVAVACQGGGTGHLPAATLAQFDQEGVTHRADDLTFRYTYYSRSTRGNRWEDRDASIIVTKQRVYIHKNEKVGLELTGESRRKSEVRREGDRVVIAAGSGQSRVSWSFRPPDDAEGWVTDMRTAINAEDAPPGASP